MKRFLKPARSKEVKRGFFSYITESVINIYNANLQYPDENLKIYFDLQDIPGYGKKNIFEICFTQDLNDYNMNKSEYFNIEEINPHVKISAYDYEKLSEGNRIQCEKVIKKYFILNEEMSNIFKQRHSEFNFENTIGLHRRATDMQMIHGFNNVNLESIFNKIEKEDFNKIFVLCDNIFDLNRIKQRYGERVITFENESTSQNEYLPFHIDPSNRSEDLVKKHITEIVFGAITLGMTKKLFCGKSNLSMYSILSNHKLNYELLN